VIATVKPQAEKYLMKEIKSDMLTSELLALYEPEYSAQQKIGVLYSRADQHTEQEMLANLEADASDEYKEFLEFLGDRVKLQGFTGYSGGLDTINNYSGTHSVYAKYDSSEIMFHVSTLLPHTPTNPVQIERKKHIGNDRLMIVFKDGDEPYAPNTLKSKQTQVVILIQPTKTPPPQDQLNPDSSTTSAPSKDKGKGVEVSDISVDITSEGASSSSPAPKRTGGAHYYRMAIASRIEIPQCEPWLPEVPIFEKGPEFREFLLAKIINIMLAMRHSTIFEKKTQREKALKFLHVVDKYGSQPEKK
jgi:RAP1 GTPase activating protein 1